jgi:hypothetical protein
MTDLTRAVTALCFRNRRQRAARDVAQGHRSRRFEALCFSNTRSFDVELKTGPGEEATAWPI